MPREIIFKAQSWNNTIFIIDKRGRNGLQLSGPIRYEIGIFLSEIGGRAMY